MKKVLLALCAVALLSAPAFASVQNIRVSGDVDSTWLLRNDFDFGGDTDDGDWTQNVFFTQTRLRVDADLTDNVGSTVALINERVWGEEDESSDGNNDIDLNLAYVTLREMLYSPLTVVAGRQNFAYGNSFIVDSAGTNRTVTVGGLDGKVEDLSKRTALDAIRFIFDYNPLTIDLLFAMVDENGDSGGSDANEDDDDVYLYGGNANYLLGDDWNSVAEAYFWVKQDRDAQAGAGTVTGDGESDKIFLPGLRVSTNPVKGLNVQGEVAFQLGNATNIDGDAVAENADREAFGAQFIANYILPFEETAKWSPVVTGVYTYVSGDDDSTDGDVGTWDPFFENQGTGTIYNALFNLTNSHVFQLSGQVSPIQDVTAKLTWLGIWLDEEVTGGSFSQLLPNGASVTQSVTTDEEVGHEIDVELVYDYTEDVQFGLIAGWFFPGDFYADSNNQTASQVLVNGNVSF